MKLNYESAGERCDTHRKASGENPVEKLHFCKPRKALKAAFFAATIIGATCCLIRRVVDTSGETVKKLRALSSACGRLDCLGDIFTLSAFKGFVKYEARA